MMSDGFDVGVIGGGSGDGFEHGVVSAAPAGDCGPLVAPLFCDFSGKSWEGEYPGLLGRFYDAVLAFGRDGFRGGVETRGGGCVGNCGEIGGTGYRARPGVGRKLLEASGGGSGGAEPTVGGGSSYGGVALCGGVGTHGCAGSGPSGVVPDGVPGLKRGGAGGGCHCEGGDGKCGSDCGSPCGYCVPLDVENKTDVFGGISGESKTERNRRWRREKKEKKKRRQGAQLSAAVRSKDWNADKLVSKRMGYFSECPAGVQEELRNTRAELMIARNKHDKVLVEKKMEELDSSVRLVERTLKVLRLQKDLAKASEKTNMRVGGWAKTVLTDASEEYVNKAASRPGSSLPSLDSIPVETVPTVQSDRDFELRMANYKLAIVALDKEADGVSWCDNQEYLRARNAIDMEYADVALTGEERIKRQVVEKVMEVFGADVTRDQMSRLAEAGLYDENLISYF